MAGKDRQNGDKCKYFLLHRFFKEHNIIDEQAQKKMPRKDEKLFGLSLRVHKNSFEIFHRNYRERCFMR